MDTLHLGLRVAARELADEPGAWCETCGYAVWPNTVQARVHADHEVRLELPLNDEDFDALLGA